MDERRGDRRLVWAPVAAATVALLWIVPEWPLLHLDDPSHWGLLGYLVSVVLLVRVAGVDCRRFPRRLLALFLAAMPLIYVANWLRHGGASRWLIAELGGLAAFGGIALLGARGNRAWLPLGIAAHGVWDAWHLAAATPYVPDWYATACALIDLPLAGWAAALHLLTRQSPRPGTG